jgi:hypothetical protein
MKQLNYFNNFDIDVILKTINIILIIPETRDG